ncbi:DUF2784 family protein [Candidatus Parcubacteria bacterium]|nr:DUF2784 family protein [Candidatus Parcubacteria bacterium]
MNYNFWADATAVLHFATLLAVILGLLLCFRYKRFRPLEAGVFILIILVWSYYGNCPLTILEEHLRKLAGNPTGITNVGFIPFYARKLLDVNIPSRVVQQSTFFTGGMIFLGSMEWLSPFFHMEIFKLRKFLRRTARKFA